MRERGDDAARALDAGVEERVIVGRVAVDVEHRPFDDVLGEALEVRQVAVDDDERRLRRDELLDDVLAGRAGARDDDVTLESSRWLPHAIPPERLADDALDEERGEVALHVGERADAADDERDGERPRARHLVHLTRARRTRPSRA